MYARSKFLQVSFARSTGIANIIGAIDGRHIRLQGPMRHASDYINRKGYYSVLLQGICDDRARFIEVFLSVGTVIDYNR